MKGMKILFFVFVLSFLIGIWWNSIPVIKQGGHFILDPSVGKMLDWNVTYGMVIIVVVISLITTLVQKYGTDQETLREIKKEQKILQEEMKKYKDNPEKLMEFNKKQMEFIPKTMEITMRPIIYTIIPLVLFFRWFNDYFSSEALAGFKFFGILSWLWFYFIFTIIISLVFKKVFKVA